MRALSFRCTLALAVLVGVAGGALAGIQADGTIESTAGGFRFPDGTLQTSAASPDEVRLPISALPVSIVQPGSYYLTQDLALSNGTAISVHADHVTIDLMGFSIRGNARGVENHGILVSASNIEIRNGTITNFGGSGIRDNGTAFQIRAIDLRVTDNQEGGIVVAGSGHLVRGCSISDNGDGVDSDGDSIDDHGIKTGVDALVMGNNVKSGHGFAVAVENGSRVEGNRATGLANGGIVGDFKLGNGSYVSIVNNDVSGLGNCISADFGSRISFNRVSGDCIGIVGSEGTTISHNTVYNTAASPSANGIVVTEDCYVTENVVHGAKVNISVNGAGNSIVGNQVNDGLTSGIEFTESGNFYADNKASGNATDFDLAATSQTDGGGNVSY